jgi:hypothetical protein
MGRRLGEGPGRLLHSYSARDLDSLPAHPQEPAAVVALGRSCRVSALRAAPRRRPDLDRPPLQRLRPDEGQGAGAADPRPRRPGGHRGEPRVRGRQERRDENGQRLRDRLHGLEAHRALGHDHREARRGRASLRDGPRDGTLRPRARDAVPDPRAVRHHGRTAVSACLPGTDLPKRAALGRGEPPARAPRHHGGRARREPRAPRPQQVARARGGSVRSRARAEQPRCSHGLRRPAAGEPRCSRPDAVLPRLPREPPLARRPEFVSATHTARGNGASRSSTGRGSVSRAGVRRGPSRSRT